MAQNRIRAAHLIAEHDPVILAQLRPGIGFRAQDALHHLFDLLDDVLFFLAQRLLIGDLKTGCPAPRCPLHKDRERPGQSSSTAFMTCAI